MTAISPDDFRRDVRIPKLLLDQLSRGEIIAPMLLAMTYLHKWSDWKTGRVAHASAGGLHTATSAAYSVRTFQDAMSRLQKMGWITRHIIRGSREDYPVTLHNYKALNDEGEVVILNSRAIVAPERKRKPQRNKGTSVDSTGDSCARKAASASVLN
jgi:hypothetical protein